MQLLDKYNELVGLVKALRAYSWTPAMTPDEGRDHPLYPSNNHFQRFPLWQAIENNIKAPVGEIDDFVTQQFKNYAHHISELQRENYDLKMQLDDAKSWNNRLSAELSAVSEAIGTTKYMDPPDGGSVSLGEQVARMKADLTGECQFGRNEITGDNIAIEQLERQLAERDAEIAKYRDAPVICSQYQALWGEWCLFLNEKHEMFVRNNVDIPIRTLIVKPGEQ